MPNDTPNIAPKDAKSDIPKRPSTASWPLPASTTSEPHGVLLYGGSFDPVHIGHVAMGHDARCLALGEDAWLVLVPAARSPHKTGDPGATGQERAAMLDLAFADVVRTRVWLDELARAAEADGPSYWVDTLERVRAAAGPTADLRFLIGADQAVAFHRWHRFRDILALARPVVVLREPWGTVEDFGTAMSELEHPQIDADAHPDVSPGAVPVWSPSELAFWLSWVVELDVINASSTAIRREIHADADTNTDRSALENLDPRVRGYIDGHGLYR